MNVTLLINIANLRYSLRTSRVLVIFLPTVATFKVKPLGFGTKVLPRVFQVIPLYPPKGPSRWKPLLAGAY